VQRITPCLWFDGNAEEAVKFYTKIFRKSKVGTITHYTEGSPMPAGTVLTIQFWLEGQEFCALNGGPEFQFTEAFSLMVNVKNQKELNTYYAKLLRGGEESQCGWLKDKFGVSWQITPVQVLKWLTSRNKKKSARMMQALMEMKRLDLKKLKQAFDGK
jgi:predicted 3-demethylubiquinone-9 3-methyltransferase (glyoxalase superfamily)